MQDWAMSGRGKVVRIAALLVALCTIVVGVTGIVAPDTLTMIRRSYYTPGGLYAVGAIRVAMGIVLILAASHTRWTGILRALGTVMCLQALTANLLGLERARAVMEWEAMQATALLRAGALVSFATGVFIAFAVTRTPSEEQRNASH